MIFKPGHTCRNLNCCQENTRYRAETIIRVRLTQSRVGLIKNISGTIMLDSVQTLVTLRQRVAAVEGLRGAAGPLYAPLGHAGIDAALGGGLARGRLHEIFAASPDDCGSATGFAAMLAVRLDRPGASIFWLRERQAEARGGCLHAPGLAELGVDPARVILGVMDDAIGLLRVAAEVVRCPDIDVAIIELWKMPRALDLTASRRLAVAAEASGVTAIMLRTEAEPTPSAAQTRWSVASAAAVPLEAQAPGFTTLDLGLLRQRGGKAGQHWQVEWDRDAHIFCEPALSRAVVPVSVGGSLATRDERRVA